MSQTGDATVVFFANGIGDHILALPALRALVKILDGSFTLAYPQGPQGFIFDGLAVDRQVPLVFQSGATFCANTAAASIGKTDEFISLAPWMSPSLAELLAKLNPARSIGFFSEFRRKVSLDFDIHSADLAFRIPKVLDPTLRLEDFAESLPLPELGIRKLSEIREMLQFGSRIMTVHNETRPAKMWDVKRLATLIYSFLDDHPEFIAFLIGRRPIDISHQRIIQCNGNLPLPYSCSLVAQSDLFLGVDSCMLHVADFARVPSIGLFGPTDAREFGFRLGPHIVIQAAKQMNEIGEEQVLTALRSILQNPEQKLVQAAEGPYGTFFVS